MKKVISILLLSLTLMTSIVLPASAKTVYSHKNQWGSVATCELNKKDIWGRRKSGTVRVSVPSWSPYVDIRMRNNGRTIWSQNNAIKGNAAKTVRVYRDFNLGNNYSKYELSFRHRTGFISTIDVVVTNKSNTKVY